MSGCGPDGDVCGISRNSPEEYRWTEGRFLSCPNHASRHATVDELVERAFREGWMKKPPCFLCGHKGPGYYQPKEHPCATEHHRLYRAAGEVRDE